MLYGFCNFVLLGIRVSFCGPIMGVPHCLAGAQHLVLELEHYSLVEKLGSNMKKQATHLFQTFEGPEF